MSSQAQNVHETHLSASASATDADVFCKQASSDHRFHLQHGPIDLVIDLRGDMDAIYLAEERARERFATILDELTRELSILRQPISVLKQKGSAPQGRVAARMWQAANLFPDSDLTPMAAVAGAVADDVQQSMIGIDRLRRIIVNNGGDIALWGMPGECFSIGIIDELSAALSSDIPAQVRFDTSVGINGVATSGWRGRSQSFGIADAVTVFANNASVADAAATLVANQVNVQSESVQREPANNRYPDSDLGERLITVDVQGLTDSEITSALSAGEAYAEAIIRKSIINSVVIALEGNYRVLGELGRASRLSRPQIFLD